MSPYKKVPLDEAYRLIGHGPVVLVSTRSRQGKYDVAPIAWTMPIQKSPSEILVGVGGSHETNRNIKTAKEFIVCVPHASQAELVRKTGSVSGSEVDKFRNFKIKSIPGKKVDARIIEGCVGYLECKLVKTLKTDDVDCFLGRCVYGAADKKAFSGRVLAEKAAGRTLHHLGNKIFAVPTKII